MARPYGKAPFNPSEPVLVRRKFSANGKHWLPDEEFDWKKRALDQRKVRNLYEAGFLKQGGDAPAQSPAPKSKSFSFFSKDKDKDDETNGKEEVRDPDDLDAIDEMSELRDIAKREGAPLKVSKVQQREAIREYRKAGD